MLDLDEADLANAHGGVPAGRAQAIRLRNFGR
jgi:hypothetical protein